MKYISVLIATVLCLMIHKVVAIDSVNIKSESDSQKIKYLSLNYPVKAIELYKQNSTKYLLRSDEETMSVYASALIAASNVQDIDLIEEIIGLIADDRLTPYRQPYLFTVINVIGVSYGKNMQYVQAIKTHKCALNHTNSNLEKMISKVNLAITYRMNNQPAVSYQILQTVDEAILDSRRAAGVLAEKGNTAMVLGKFDLAMRAYKSARTQYLKGGHRRNAMRVIVHLLGAALLDEQFDLFNASRKTLNPQSRSYLTEHELIYLKWLDLVYLSIQNNQISELTVSYTLHNFTVFIEAGFQAPVERLLEKLKAQHVVSLEPHTTNGVAKINDKLAHGWCDEG
ncbi:hypothetical protein [Pseudoalteromonas luteoviolacea]|uniref:MalT-like TPR region domain-containing protein n=1 Tax=Pseudoalteromonas luteoviolacea S4054 TaxID=1129367 RepID=A0A0F6AHP6_9GAMM|nr:hypothetical protein [Pseudoalteromonas luteoviolacea]AOT11047.1 hypothetical protein S4054249_24750 [Pseudoalteromonas luteoviolacea]AOT15789.1 hypothetical protein S40542_23760 [Pseudoalteromonas luteoviolacea]AOT20868.1 hypothetical protein S4054_24670 [Pseudoalteromonas luteoviolacea]KKE85755.1 hypothetical protein N479_24685 [Pseudoalteromonas luteoviolacea S4054]KZN71114.1 hypothetical protein N481_19740 [Pseudoalteromonas luteoviolacea S4047-1]